MSDATLLMCSEDWSLGCGPHDFTAAQNADRYRLRDSSVSPKTAKKPMAYTGPVHTKYFIEKTFEKSAAFQSETVMRLGSQLV